MQGVGNTWRQGFEIVSSVMATAHSLLGLGCELLVGCAAGGGSMVCPPTDGTSVTVWAVVVGIYVLLIEAEAVACGGACSGTICGKGPLFHRKCHLGIIPKASWCVQPIVCGIARHILPQWQSLCGQLCAKYVTYRWSCHTLPVGMLANEWLGKAGTAGSIPAWWRPALHPWHCLWEGDEGRNRYQWNVAFRAI